ncbi:hypothetical protein Pcinc_016069 [Petrolisthes cinctipes]|uniref:IRF tryptophan pentad repeat domain-containing protein n=1 Tax=Petrolisthes cinctipes TaxID=88211 RepID=A0AAE1KQ28_PETCI|nr:hypothetical protein Pcinc_016069 [Petrolisthes cinctipes]
MTPVPTIVDAPMDLSLKNRKKMRLEEFLRQNLDQAPAGRVIQWVDRNEGVFRILWTHQSSGAFTQQDAALFRYWALARGKPPNLSSVELKQSLRMALNKSPSVQRLNSIHDEHRYFRFTEWGSRKASSSSRSCQRPQTYSPTEEANRKRSSPSARPSPSLIHHHHHRQEAPHIAGSSHFLPDPLLVKSEVPLEQMALPWPSHDLEKPLECRQGNTNCSIPLEKSTDPFTFDKPGDTHDLENEIKYFSTLEKPMAFLGEDNATNPFALEKLMDPFASKKSKSHIPASHHLDEHLGRVMWQEKQVRRNTLLAARLMERSPRSSVFSHLTETNRVPETHHLSLSSSSELFPSVPCGASDSYNAGASVYNGGTSSFGGGAIMYGGGMSNYDTSSNLERWSDPTCFLVLGGVECAWGRQSKGRGRPDRAGCLWRTRRSEGPLARRVMGSR